MPKANKLQLRGFMMDFQSLEGVFYRVLGIHADLDEPVRAACMEVLNEVPFTEGMSGDQARRFLLETICRKLDLAAGRLRSVLDGLAAQKVFPNQIQKKQLRVALESLGSEKLKKWFVANGSDARNLNISSVTEEDVIKSFADMYENPKVKRKDRRTGVDDELRKNMRESIFSTWVYRCCDEKCVRKYVNTDCRKRYFDDYFEHVSFFHPVSFARGCALAVLRPPRKKSSTAVECENELFRTIVQATESLSNHCFMAVVLDSDVFEREEIWSMSLKATLFAEKQRAVNLKSRFFRPDTISIETRKHVPEENLSGARFDLAYLGLYYRDCLFVRREGGDDRFSLVLLFEKNESDPNPIPCPACRSLNVKGNSFPTLGVRSWECSNLTCPGRSLYNRGFRFSPVSVIRQRAIENESDQISQDFLAQWRLDVVSEKTESDILEMLIRHYTFYGDSIGFFGKPCAAKTMLGRTVTNYRLKKEPQITVSSFAAEPYFSRFLGPIDIEQYSAPSLHKRIDSVGVYHGDSRGAAQILASKSIDAAVTSPPYYNAREYSQWANFYGYLYDMTACAEVVLEALRPGGYYLYNIFDYFDNDRTVALSAMGRRRLSLAAHIAHSFCDRGFLLEGNVVWFKGHIEGKRNFNNGNFSPYYQRPHNAWEHVLVFRKPGAEVKKISFPTVLHARPVIKMIGGENTYGHTAPFPREIPDLICSQLPAGSHVLDPYAGSMTTAESAVAYDHRATMIELHEHYLELGVSRLQKDSTENACLFEV